MKAVDFKALTHLDHTFYIQSRTTVSITKICYIRMDTQEMNFFGMIIQTKESPTGYKIYVFKAEKAIVSPCKYIL